MMIMFEVALKDGILINPDDRADWGNTHFNVFAQDEHKAWGEVAKLGFKPSEVKRLWAVRYVG